MAASLNFELRKVNENSELRNASWKGEWTIGNIYAAFAEVCINPEAMRNISIAEVLWDQYVQDWRNENFTRSSIELRSQNLESNFAKDPPRGYELRRVVYFDAWKPNPIVKIIHYLKGGTNATDLPNGDLAEYHLLDEERLLGLKNIRAETRNFPFGELPTRKYHLLVDILHKPPHVWIQFEISEQKFQFDKFMSKVLEELEEVNRLYEDNLSILSSMHFG